MDVKEPLNLYHYGVGGPFWDQRIKQHKMAMILFYVSDYIFEGRLHILDISTELNLIWLLGVTKSV